MENENKQNKLSKFHDKNYKLLLLIPVSLLLFSLIYLGTFYSRNQDFIYKDISLTGGTSVTINDKINVAELKQALSEKLENIKTREIYDVISREQKAIILEIETEGCGQSEIKQTKIILEDYLGYELIDGDNASFECTGSSLGESFYMQLLTAIFAAFMAMACVVFLIFGDSIRIKVVSLMGTLSILFLLFKKLIPGGIFLALFVILVVFFLFEFFKKNSKREKFSKRKLISFLPLMILLVVLFFFLNFINWIIVFLAFLLFYLYAFYSIPSIAVIISAFADILMTLVLVNLLGIQMSSAGIIAFLMLIGYSVDTDILLTTRILKRDEGSLNKRIFGAFKTGTTMTLTSLLAVIFALIVVSSFSSVLTQIFTILAIGLGFDLLNTWITNVSILKWYVKKKK